MDEGNIIEMEGFRVVAVPDTGVCIIGPSGHYWVVLPDRLCQERDEDEMARAYRERVK